MMRTRIKICGITRPEDGIAAVDCGVDAIGLVFYPPSPRAVNLTTAQKICAVIPPFVTIVGLFVNPRPDEVIAITANLHLDLIQFHGDESPELCASFGYPYIKALALRNEIDLSNYARDYATSSGLLVDTYQPGIAGGSGIVCNWDLIPEERNFPLILAGGLNPNNIGMAIRRVRPYAVDVSSGVEVAKGIKDYTLIRNFVQAVRKLD